MKRSRGFTLLELILVALLVMVLVGLSTPSFRRTFSGLALKNTSFDISKMINYAQERAIVDKKIYKIKLDFGKGEYRLLEVAAVTEPPGYKDTAVAGRFGKLYAVPQGVSINGTKDVIMFYPDGHCDYPDGKNEDVRIDVRGGEGEPGYTITAKTFGGLVDVKETTDAKK